MSRHLRPRATHRTPATLALLVALAAPSVQAAETLAQGDVFGDWNVNCQPMTPDDPTVHCQLYQDVIVQQEGQEPQTIMRLRIRYEPNEQIAAGIFELPLGLFLPFGMVMQVDQGDQLRIPIQTCQPTGCRVLVPLDAAQEAIFRNGTLLKVGLLTYTQQPVSMSLSLIGFSAGMDALRASYATGG